MLKLVLTLVLGLLLSSTALGERTVSSHLGSKDLVRLQKVFIEGLASNDLQAIYYATLNIEPTNANERDGLCKRLASLHEESKVNDFEKDFYLVGSHKNLRCTEKLPEALLSKLYSALATPAVSAPELYYRLLTNKYLGVQIDEGTRTKIVKNLKELLKKDETALSLGYIFHVAAEMGAPAAFVAERVEDTIKQADEVNGKMLQFEGGLSITALVLNGAFRVSKVFDKPVPVSPEQAVKFANYLLSRRTVQTAKGAHVLIESLKTLTGIGKIAPICIQLIGSGQLEADSPQLTVAVLDLLGKPLSPVPQNIFGKIVVKKDNVVLAEKVQFVSKSSDKSTFVADLASYKPTRGRYVVDISTDSIYKQTLDFKVLGRVKVHLLELGIGESDASSSVKKQTVNYPSKLGEQLSADSTQKLLLKSILVDEGTTKVITVHQAFVRLFNEEADKEVIFIAEQDSSKAYKFDMDVGARAKDFEHKSGVYRMYLIVGDASISNSFEWHVADVELKFPTDTKEPKKQPIRSALPEIEHLFREPEKRPSRIVSDIFTGLCLTPLVLLFIVWGKFGINVSNFSFSLSTVGFHLGFGSILTLFGIFWWKLNMFQTLRLLIPLSIFTFLCGNRMLRRLYAQRLAKSPPSAAGSSSS